MSQVKTGIKSKKSTAATTAKTTTPTVSGLGAADLVDNVQAEPVSLGNVKVIYGANDSSFGNLVGKKVGVVRASLAETFNIPADAKPLIDGKEVTEDTVLVAEQTLEFHKISGRKG